MNKSTRQYCFLVPSNSVSQRGFMFSVTSLYCCARWSSVTKDLLQRSASFSSDSGYSTSFTSSASLSASSVAARLSFQLLLLLFSSRSSSGAAILVCVARSSSWSLNSSFNVALCVYSSRSLCLWGLSYGGGVSARTFAGKLLFFLASIVIIIE